MLVGVDIGGSKTLVAVFGQSATEPPSGTLRFPTETEAQLEIKLITEAITKLLDGNPATAIVVGSRGEMDEAGTVTDQKILHWDKVPLKERLSTAFNCPVAVHHDTSLACLAEARLGAGKGRRTVLYITISSGIGTALTVDGNVVIEKSAGGDMVLGQTVLDDKAKASTFEKLFSGAAIKQNYGKQGSDIDDQATWEELSEGFAVGINNLIVFAEPDIVVLGGGIGSHLEKFGTPLVKLLQKYNTSQFPLPPLAEAELGDIVVVQGAALLAGELTHAQ